MIKHQKPTSVPDLKGSELPLPLPLKLTHFNTTLNINKTEHKNYQVSTVSTLGQLPRKLQ